ncbi:HNH endonuclease [Marinomonas sp. S3726]|uniref:HNH endonuclease n=1 Tax=Marinomonas sp. S3726 TaxID=579484 RepID=UPI0006964056|nr:HNH endonuclease [Marinomonas sp. S3726]
MNLNDEGKKILEVLVSHLERVKPGRQDTYLGYKQMHEILSLPRVRERWGDSLKIQGLSALAEWTERNELPGITGLIISKTTFEPGKGYFTLFNKNESDYKWWEEEIRKSTVYDWSTYVSSNIEFIAVDLDTPERDDLTVSRIIRDCSLSYFVKQIHNYECQICGLAIGLSGGNKYAEAHHLKPLGKPHNGPDCIENMICVCPNHHAMLDYGAIEIDTSKIKQIKEHEISREYINYHNINILKS